MCESAVVGRKTRSSTHLSLLDDLPEQEWVEVGRRLALVESGKQWWLGDWWVAGDRYSENYEYGTRVATAEELGLDPKTCRNAAVVARAFETSRRRDVSFKHHAALTALSELEQDHWLDVCEEQEWSVGQLRQELRAKLTAAAIAERSGEFAAPRIALAELERPKAKKRQNATKLVGRGIQHGGTPQNSTIEKGRVNEKVAKALGTSPRSI